MSAETEACAPADCRHGAGDGFGPKGGAGSAPPPAVGASFLAPRLSPAARHARFQYLARFGGDHLRQRFCGFFLYFLSFLRVLVILLPRPNPARGTVGAASSRMKERTCAVVIRSGSMTPRVARRCIVANRARREAMVCSLLPSLHAQVDEVPGHNRFLEQGLRLPGGELPRLRRIQGRRTQPEEPAEEGTPGRPAPWDVLLTVLLSASRYLLCRFC